MLLRWITLTCSQRISRTEWDCLMPLWSRLKQPAIPWCHQSLLIWSSRTDMIRHLLLRRCSFLFKHVQTMIVCFLSRVMFPWAVSFFVSAIAISLFSPDIIRFVFNHQQRAVAMSLFAASRPLSIDHPRHLWHRSCRHEADRLVGIGADKMINNFGLVQSYPVVTCSYYSCYTAILSCSYYTIVAEPSVPATHWL